MGQSETENLRWERFGCLDGAIDVHQSATFANDAIEHERKEANVGSCK